MSKNQVKRKGRMPNADYIKIQANFCYLVDHIEEPEKLGNKLFEKKVFDTDQKNEIQKIFRNAEKGRYTATDKLVMYVLYCGDVYGRFIQCLRELGYREIVNVLEHTTDSKNKSNLMLERDRTRHQLEDLHKDHDLTKQELENLKKQMETQDGDSKQMLKKIEKLETYKKQTEEKEALTKKRIDELETCIKTLTLNEEDIIQPQLLHGTLSGNTSYTSDGTLSGNTSDTSDKKDTRQQQQQQLFDVCLHGTLDDIKKMVNIDVNVRGGVLNQTPLFKCCESRVSPVDKIQYLVSHQADINTRDNINDTILHWACLHGTLSTVEYLVDDLHMNVNTTGCMDLTPLFDCCISRVSPVDKIKYLVSHQAEINARDMFNNTILHQACWLGTLSTVQYLVDCLHLDVHVKNKDGQTVLDYCRKSYTEPNEKMQYINAKTSFFKSFFSAFLWAFRFSLGFSLFFGL